MPHPLSFQDAGSQWLMVARRIAGMKLSSWLLSESKMKRRWAYLTSGAIPSMDSEHISQDRWRENTNTMDIKMGEKVFALRNMTTYRRGREGRTEVFLLVITLSIPTRDLRLLIATYSCTRRLSQILRGGSLTDRHRLGFLGSEKDSFFLQIVAR